jgi:LuxR family maltose regulon positive regulatory protein
VTTEARPPAQGRDVERDRLLATKITIPRIRRERLRRIRLISQLDEGAACGLTLVCTPAGFGKTTLLGDWAQTASQRIAWLSLDPEDNDPVRFWRYVVAALERADVTVGEDVQSMFISPREGSSRGVVTALINGLEAVGDEVTLILDDYHVIVSAPIHEGLTFFLNNIPSRVHIVIATRSDPPLQLARLRAGGRLAELRGFDLRFTPDETTSFLREVWELNLSPEAVAGLEARTEGWAVGLQLAALSLQGRPDPDTFLQAFAGTHRYVLDYLSEEVLELQTDRVRTFLLRTSILERLCGPLCNAVTQESDGWEMLERLERANLFLVPLDDERRWYRFHRLFADLLRSRLRQNEPKLVPELHLRAAAWCEERGLVDDAVHHSLGANDLNRVARLVENHVEELLLRRSERATLDRWLSALSRQVVASRPRVMIAQGIAAELECRLDEAQSLLESALQGPADPEDLHEPSVGRAASVLTNVPAATAVMRADFARLRGEAERAEAFAREALSRVTPDDRLLASLARYHISIAGWMVGRLSEVEQELQEIVEERRLAGERYLAVRACYDLGWVQQAGGRLGAAVHTYRKALDIITDPGRRPPPEAGLALVGLAEVMRKRGDLDSALQHSVEGVERCRRLVYALPLAAGLVTLAWVRQAKGTPGLALEAVEEAVQTVPSRDIVSLHNPGPAERARLLLAQGHLDDAVRWSDEKGLLDDDEVSYARERDYLVLARICLAQSEPDRALGLLDRLEAIAESHGRTGSLIEIRALRSLALQASGDRDAALVVLDGVLSLARPEGYVRVIADEGPPMAALLRSLLGARRRGRVGSVSGSEMAFIKRIMVAFGHGDRDEKFPHDVSGLVVPLTRRELEVLAKIAEGRKNREIAEELVVTLETVKKHNAHIFEKLGATNRTEAVNLAREIGLIS